RSTARNSRGGVSLARGKSAPPIFSGQRVQLLGCRTGLQGTYPVASRVLRFIQCVISREEHLVDVLPMVGIGGGTDRDAELELRDRTLGGGIGDLQRPNRGAHAGSDGRGVFNGGVGEEYDE